MLVMILTLIRPLLKRPMIRDVTASSAVSGTCILVLATFGIAKGAVFYPPFFFVCRLANWAYIVTARAQHAACIEECFHSSHRTPDSFERRRLACRLGLLAAIVTLTGCATTRVAPGPSLAETSIEGGLTAFEHAAVMFGNDLKASAKAPDDTGKAHKAFQSGLTMLDLRCSRYLDSVGSANQAASNERRQTSLIGGFASAIMGLAGNSAKEIAGVATAFSFAGSSMESFTTAYLFSDAAASVTKIVRESQLAWLGSVATPDNLTNMYSSDAVRLLSAYEQLCRPTQIRALIDQSIAKGKVVAERMKPSDADVETILQSLHAALGVSVSEAQAIVLYAWFKNPGQRTSGANLSTADPVALLLTNRSAQILERQLAQAFLPISLAGSPVPERWGPGVKSLVPAMQGAAGDGSGAAAPPAAIALSPKPTAVQRPSVPLLFIR